MKASGCRACRRGAVAPAMTFQSGGDRLTFPFGMILDWFLLWNAGVGFDFDAPVWVEQGGDDDHGGGGADEAEELAVDAAGGLPVFGVGEVDAGAVDVLDGTAGVFECGGDEGEALVGLFGDVGVVGADGAGAGDVDMVADADGAGEADDGLEGRWCRGCWCVWSWSWMHVIWLNQARLLIWYSRS